MIALDTVDHLTCIRLATPSDAAAVGALRTREYQASANFRISNARFIEKLNWSADDDARHVVGIWREGLLIATTRIEWLADQNQLVDYASGFRPPFGDFEWPALATSRTAIDTAHHRTGLHLLFRCHNVEAALRSKVRYLYGYGAYTAAGLRVLSDLGYEFAARPDQDPDLEAERPWQLIRLDLPRQGQRALAWLHQSVASLNRQYPWIGPRLDLNWRGA